MLTHDFSPVRLVVIQASPFCNINCRYCYLPDRSSTRRMSVEKLAEVYKFLFRDPSLVSPRLRILWHAGEPLAVPVSFYKDSLKLQHLFCPPGVSVLNSIQTNGMLLDDEWLQFIKENRIGVGVSLDGPEELHDANRVTRAGLGTFGKVRDAIRRLQREQIPFHVSTVLTEASLDRPHDLWQTYCELGVTRVHLLIEELQGVHLIRNLKRDMLQSRLESFYRVLEDCRAASTTKVYIRELDDIHDRIVQGCVPLREVEQIPLGIISISIDGDVSTFSPELLGAKSAEYGNFVFGNTSTSTLQQIVQHPTFRSVYKAITRGFNECKRVCDYFAFCGGGQPSIKLHENGSFESTETPSCQMRIKAPVNVLREKGRTKLYKLE